MILRDLSDIDVNRWVGRTTDGKTYQDFMDLASVPNEYFPKPDFVNYAIEPGRTLLAPDGGAVHTYIFELVGNYFIIIGRESPFYIGFCSPFWVMEDSSEQTE